MTESRTTDARSRAEDPGRAFVAPDPSPVSDSLLRLLRCPACKLSPLSPPADGDPTVLACNLCRVRYPVIGGIPDFLSGMDPKQFANHEEWDTKLELLKRWFLEERTGAPGNGTGWRPSPDALLKYFKLSKIGGHGGNVLDIGCGEGHRAGHFADKTYYGIDPLTLKTWYPFPFARGIGESLPFFDHSFDVVVSVETLDHVLDPDRFLDEACRVLLPGGALFLFVGLDPSCLEPRTREARDTAFTTTEDQVHLRTFLPEYFHDALLDRFEQLDVDLDRGYLAVWGWQRRR